MAVPERKLEALAAEYRAPLTRYFQRRLRGRPDAEDLVQEVFIRLTRQDDLDTVEHLDGWIFHVAANVLRDRLRRDAIRAEPDPPPFYEPEDEAAISPERALIGRDALERVIRALNDLPELTRAVFAQYHFDGVAQVEIARRLGVSLSTVEKHMNKAGQHLLRRARGIR